MFPMYTARAPPSVKSPYMRRRDFLAGLFALAAVPKAMGQTAPGADQHASEALPVPSPEDKAAILQNGDETWALRNGILKDESSSDDEVADFLLETSAWPLWRALDPVFGVRGLRLDPAPQIAQEGYPAAQVVGLGEHGTLVLRNPGSPAPEPGPFAESAGAGTAFRLRCADGADRIVTNKHVQVGLSGKDPRKDPADIDVATFPASLASRHTPPLLSLDPELTTERLDGSLVLVAGVKEDETSIREDEKAPGVIPGTKLMGGRAIRMTSRLYTFIQDNSPVFNQSLAPGFKSWFLEKILPGSPEDTLEKLVQNDAASCVYVESPGEGEMYAALSNEEALKVIILQNAQGTSGAPVQAWNKLTGRWELCGINHKGIPIIHPKTKEWMYLGVFHGPEALAEGVRRCIEGEK